MCSSLSNSSFLPLFLIVLSRVLLSVPPDYISLATRVPICSLWVFDVSSRLLLLLIVTLRSLLVVSDHVLSLLYLHLRTPMLRIISFITLVPWNLHLSVIPLASVPCFVIDFIFYFLKVDISLSCLLVVVVSLYSLYILILSLYWVRLYFSFLKMRIPLLCLNLILDLYYSLILSLLYNSSYYHLYFVIFCLLVCLDLIHALTFLCSVTQLIICFIALFSVQYFYSRFSSSWSWRLG